MVEIKIDPEKCEGCGECVKICPLDVLELAEFGGKKIARVVNIDLCFKCHGCEQNCIQGAIKVYPPIDDQRR
jgi:NAD-dependent dihydropyrimidine dehydrogenase PreA subunit